MQAQALNGRYQIESILGQGGMATVYRGRDLRLGRPVAIKLLHNQYAGDDEFLQRFAHEAMSAAHLSAHPNIVDIYDVGQDGNQNYIVMELIEGEDLKMLIRREAPLPPERALTIAAQIADGLDYAHRRGLVHRDVKPQNVLLPPDEQVRIADFGIAKSHLSTAVTQTGITFGTADYISPEQAQGQPATPRSDIYSLGVMLFEMLTGRLPFSGTNPMTVALQHIQQPPPSLRQLNPTIPPALEQLVLQAIAKDPQQRPATAADFARLMREYLAGRFQQTVVSPVPQAAPRPVATQPWQPATQAYAPAPQTRRQPAPRYAPPPLAAPQRERGSLGFGTLLIGLLLLGGLLTLAYMALNTDLAGWFGGGAVVPGATQTPAPTLTPEPDATPVPVVELPSFVGQPEANARSQLEQLGLRLYVNPDDASVQPQYSTEYPRATIMAQDPPPGSDVPVGSEVKLVVSLGPRLADVPDVTRLRFSDAEAQLVADGFDVERVDAASQTVPAGFVISQDPQGGVRLPQSETIRVSVSLGDVVAFPDVVANGTQRDAAVSRIEAAGFRIVAEDVQGREVLGAQFDRFQAGEVVSATADGIPIDARGKFVPRGADVVIAIRAP